MSENQINTYYVSTKGDDSNPGTLELPFRSINNAVSKVKAGDTIIIREGIYKEKIYLEDLNGEEGNLR